MTDLRALLKDLVAEILREELADRVQTSKPKTPLTPEAIGVENRSENITMMDGLLTERMVKRLADNGPKDLCLGAKVVVTPLARETALFMGVSLKQLDRR